jgi:hypothetical protein
MDDVQQSGASVRNIDEAAPGVGGSYALTMAAGVASAFAEPADDFDVSGNPDRSSSCGCRSPYPIIVIVFQPVTKVLDGKRSSPVGYCIYCQATDELTNEHILPFGLSGTAVLPKSSCKACAKIT